MDRDAAHTHAKSAKHHDYYFPPATPDAAPEDANVRLGLSNEVQERLESRVSLTTTVAVLTALTLSGSLIVGAIKVIAAATRSYDQMERVMATVAHFDSTLARFDGRLRALEDRKPPKVGGAR